VSYTNGIGNQQFPGAAEAAAASGADRTAKTHQGAASAVLSDVFSKTDPADQTNVSRTANVVAQALSQSDIRPEKVAALQQMIASGTYNVPASDVAGKVLSALLR
jgi:negative regulator of flagellin synthesis FlgM